jgi:outer membrane protein OmpA-like peptidoglycan-associated protein
VEAIDRVDFRVTLHVPEGTDMPVFTEASTTSPLLRRWDQKSAALPVREGIWIDLEDGVQVQFSPDGRYRTGDYWLIPARTETGDVVWPAEDGPDGDRVPTPQAPDGIHHHVAPLARITVADGGSVQCDAECRCTFEPLPACPDGELVDEGSEATVTRVDAVIFAGEGTAVLTDSAREQAVVNAGRIREQLEAGPSRRVAVVGYVTPDEAANISNPAEISEERAEVVRRLYSERIEPDRITSYGAGIDEGSNPRPRADTFVITPATGGAREQALRVLDRIDNIGSNRAVVLLDAGLTRPKAVGETSVTGLRSLLGVGEDTAKTIRESALVLAEERS